MSLFPRYRLSDRVGPRHYRHTILWGFLPLGTVFFLALTMFLFGEPEPSLFLITGILVGTMLILKGAHDLKKPTVRTSRWGRKRAESIDAWFPVFLFIIQTVYLLAGTAGIWLAIVATGGRFPQMIHLNLFFLVSMIPIWRWSYSKAYTSKNPSAVALHKVIRYLTFLIFTVMLCTIATITLLPKQEHSSDEVNPVLIMIWIFTVLVGLATLMFIVERLPKRSPHHLQDEPSEFVSPDSPADR